MVMSALLRVVLMIVGAAKGYVRRMCLAREVRRSRAQRGSRRPRWRVGWNQWGWKRVRSGGCFHRVGVVWHPQVMGRRVRYDGRSTDTTVCFDGSGWFIVTREAGNDEMALLCLWLKYYMVHHHLTTTFACLLIYLFTVASFTWLFYSTTFACLLISPVTIASFTWSLYGAPSSYHYIRLFINLTPYYGVFYLTIIWCTDI